MADVADVVNVTGKESEFDVVEIEPTTSTPLEMNENSHTSKCKTISLVNIDEWLEEHGLSTFAEKIKEAGIAEVEHLQDVQEVDAQSDFGMSKFQAKRLLREFSEWKNQQQQAKRSTHAASSTLKTNNNAVVVTLPPAFQGFFGTRDGGKSIIVSSKVLEKKWSALWYEKFLNPFQEKSNSFILKMCESKQHKYRCQRECEKWARKERDRRIGILLLVQKNTTGWSAYFKRKSIYGTFSLLQEKYPAVAVLNANSACKGDYEACALYRDEVDKLDDLLKNNEDNLKQSISDTLNENGTVKTGEEEAYEFYQPLTKNIEEARSLIVCETDRINQVIESCQEKYGKTVQEKYQKRKADKNTKKSRKQRKRQ